MNIAVLQLGYLQANCYLVSDNGRCAIVDPGDWGSRLADRLDSLKLEPACVLLTHGHFDHVGAVEGLLARYPDLPVYLHEADTHLTPELCRGLRWNRFYGEGDTVTMEGLTFRVLHTPGHTPGSVCLQCGDVLFSGDTLFAGSCGRTDFPLGDHRQMEQSLQRLVTLPEQLRVLPGHGGETTMGREKRCNPYIR